MLTELENAISEQFNFIASERLGGNIVKLEFHKGALFGLRLAERLIEEARKDAEPVEEKFTPTNTARNAIVHACDGCLLPSPTMENCFECFNRRKE
jgi:hypothetical protein